MQALGDDFLCWLMVQGSVWDQESMVELFDHTLI